MKQNLFNKLWLRVGMIVAIMTTALSGTAWAADETITFSSLGLTNGEQYTTINGTDCVLTFGDGGNDGKYYNTGAAIRVYGGGHMTVSSTTKTIESIKLTFGSGDGTNAITTNVGTYNNGTWSGSANSVTFTVGGTSGHRRIASVAVTYAGGGSTLTASDLAITNASTALVFDLYNNASAQTISYTTSGTGAVTVSGGEGYVTTSVNESTKTITVTPLAVTPSAQTITVNQAADATYAAGSATFTVNITDSTPFDGVIFDATEDTGTSPITKDNVSFACSNGVLNNGSEYRMYKNSVTTISTTDGSLITKIEFTGVSGNPASGFGNQTGWTTSGYNGVWEGEAESVSFTASGAQVRATLIKVTVEANTNPSFTISNNNEIAYNATSGSFDFAISNPVDGGTTSVSESVDWISNAAVSGNTVTFTTTANEATTSREGVITLTYTYGEENITKEVTVTQAGNPNGPGTENNPYTVAQARAAIDANTGITGVYATGVVTAIPTAWSTQYNNITFNFVDADGDGNVLQAYRCVSTNNADASTVAVGDIVVVYGNLTKYGSTYEFGQGCQLVSLTHPVVAVEAPTFSLASGTFAEAQTVTITCATQGATIYYTIDGSEPTAESTEYTGAITVSTTMTIKAIAIKGEDQSAIASATYTIFVLEDGVFNFAAKMSDYGSGIEPTAEGSYYEEEASTWTAGNVTLVASGKYRWWNNDGTLRFYHPEEGSSSMTFSVPNGKVITQIVVTGSGVEKLSSGDNGYVSGTWTGYSQTVQLDYTQETGSTNVQIVTVTYIDACKPTTITLNAQGYATFASTSPVDLDETADCTAWAITAIEGTSITFTQVEGVVAAGTGLLLKGAAGATITPEYSTNAGSAVTGNLLEAIVTPTDIVADQYYGLSGKTFVKVNAGQVPAGKALLPASALTTGVKTFTFSIDDDATGISTVESFTEEGAIYNLAGQRISKMQKGINIVNGKKILK